MHRRPLCLVCIALMIAIWILKFCGAPIFHVPRMGGSCRERLAEGEKVRVTGQITGRQKKTNSTQYILSNSEASFEGSEIHFYRILVTVADTTVMHAGDSALSQQELQKEALPLGSCVLFSGTLKETESAGNPGQFDAREYYGCQGIWYTMFAESAERLDREERPSLMLRLKEAFLQLRGRMEEIIFSSMPEEEAGILCAMLLGDRSALDPATKRGFQAGGVMHVLSISGLHITLFGTFVFKGLQYLFFLVRRRAGRREQKAAACLSAVFLFLYCLFCGFPVSCVRAFLMFLVYLGAGLFRKTYDLPCALALAGILILASEPGYLFFSGFQLSFMAVAGVSFAYPALASLVPESVRENRRRNKTAGMVLSWASVNLCTVPVSVWYYYELPLLSLPVNLLILPGLGAAMGTGMIGSIAGMLWAPLGNAALIPSGLILKGWVFLTEHIRKMPGAVWNCGQPALWKVIACYGGIAAALFFIRRAEGSGRKNRRLLFSACLILSLSFAVLFSKERAELTLAMLDVGQGDGLVLTAGDGNSFLIDGGSLDEKQVGIYRILPYLKARGISRIEGIFLTHDDSDHYSGIEEILTGIRDGSAEVKVGKLFMPCWMMSTDTGLRLKCEAEAAGAEVVGLRTGDRLICGRTVIDVLYPPENGTVTGNDGSLVLLVRDQSFTALLTGDLGEEGEKEIAEGLEKVTCLKAGHHGSSTSSSERFVKAASPRIALISCGEGNPYGHPHRETLQRLGGSDIYRTDRSGCITVSLKNSGEYCVKKFLQ